MAEDQKPSVLHVELDWASESLFRGKNQSGAALLLDGKKKQAVSPMEALLASLSGCMGIDVVNILTRMRADFHSLSITAEGEQNSEPPKYFRRILITFRLKGTVPRDRVEHAIRLSFDTYCSVFHSLRKDIEIAYDIKITQG